MNYNYQLLLFHMEYLVILYSKSPIVCGQLMNSADRPAVTTYFHRSCHHVNRQVLVIPRTSAIV